MVSFVTDSNLNVFRASWSRDDLYDGSQNILDLVTSKPAGYYPISRMYTDECITQHATQVCSVHYEPPDNSTVPMLVEEKRLQCTPYIATYNVSISYMRGVRHLTYNTSSAENLRFRHQEDCVSDSQNPDKCTKNWRSSLSYWYQKATVRAILDSVGYNLEYEWTQSVSRYPSNTFSFPYRLANSTEIALGEVLPTFNKQELSK